jgi:hypothetical protein
MRPDHRVEASVRRLGDELAVEAMTDGDQRKLGMT